MTKSRQQPYSTRLQTEMGEDNGKDNGGGRTDDNPNNLVTSYKSGKPQTYLIVQRLNNRTRATYIGHMGHV